MEPQSSTKPKRALSDVGSMGWLTESSIMPNKRREIAGVGASSMLELKAQLYKSQEEAKLSGKEQVLCSDQFLEVSRAKKKADAKDLFSGKNSGVQSRAHRDKLELKAINDGSVVYAALEKKAELYEKLAKGQLSDEEDKEKYCVDFFSKSLVDEGSRRPQDGDTYATEQLNYEVGESDVDGLPYTKPVGLGRAAVTVDTEEHKRFVREVHEEVNQAREKVSELKARREEQINIRREKLRQAYLRKQLEKLKAAAKTEQKGLSTE